MADEPLDTSLSFLEERISMPIEVGTALSEMLVAHALHGQQRTADGANHGLEMQRSLFAVSTSQISGVGALAHRTADESGAGSARFVGNNPGSNPPKA